MKTCMNCGARQPEDYETASVCADAKVDRSQDQSWVEREVSAIVEANRHLSGIADDQCNTITILETQVRDLKDLVVKMARER